MSVDKREQLARKRAVWLRNYQRARGRALTRLAQQYPDQFKEILEEERLSDEANGKTWLDISGTTHTNSDLYLPTHRQDSSYRPKQAVANNKGEGDNGGEA